MANQRIIRINEAIRKEVAELIRNEIKDPRVSNALISVVEVDTTSDLKHCKIYISVLEEAKRADALKGLSVASGFIRKEIARRVNLRNTPELMFKIDESMEYGMKMAKVIHEVMQSTGKEQ